MKAFAIEKYGNHPLKLMNFPIPTVGEHDLLVEIYAASVNPIDFKLRDGKVKILLRYDMPLILGNDCAGIVTKVGIKVTRFKIGDEVYARAPKNRIGTFAEYIAIAEDAVALKPKNISFEEAASIPLVGLTSYQVLHDVMKLKSGEKVLIQAGAGGVGTFAIQFAKTLGAFVTTTASDAGFDLVKSLGADQVINYKSENFVDILQGYDAVYDTLGDESLEKSFKIIKPGGSIVSVSGVPNAQFAREQQLGLLKILLFSIITRKITKLEKLYDATYTFHFMSANGKQLGIIGKLIEEDKIKPVIDKTFPFCETQDALNYLESGRAKGKVVIKLK
ncbi:MAG: NADPH:quinone reductase [Gammaproteobacteria bacterium]|nr:MAG: NADPH:quinone reductase [Gammaproteobacteria bacterium]